MSGRFAFVRLAELGLFGFVTVRALQQWRRRRDAAGAWLAAMFGALAACVLLGLLLLDHSDSTATSVGRRLVLVTLLLFPLCLYRFTATFTPARAVVDRAVTLVALLPLVVTVLLPRIPRAGTPRPPWFDGYVILLLVCWTVVSAVATTRLWLAGRDQPTVPRRRMRMLSAGSVAVNVALVVAGVASTSTPATVRVVTAVAGLASAVLFFLAFDPPGPLRTLWREPELAAFRRAQAALLQASSAEEAAAIVVPHAARILGGRGALLATADGAVLASWGLDDAEAAERARSLASDDGAGDGSARVQPDTLAFPLRVGWLAVEASPYTPFFGDEEFTLLQALAHSIDVVLDRRASRDALEEREQQLAQAQALAHLGSWSWDVARDQVTWSEELYRIFGLSPDDFDATYAGFVRQIHPADRASVEAQVAEAYRTGLPFSFDHRVAGDESRWVHGRGQVVTDETGRLVRMHGTAQDVSAERRAQEELSVLARRQSAVARLGQRALAGLTLESLCEQAVGVVLRELEVELAVVLEVLDDDDRLLVRAAEGWGDELEGSYVRRAGQPGYTIATRRPVVVNDLAEEARFEPWEPLTTAGATSGASVPVQGHGWLFGVLMAHSLDGRLFRPNDVDFLQAVANVLAAAIERHQSERELAHHALHDALTGLPNRVLLLDRLEQALMRARRQHSSLALLFLDVDHFKVVNDGLGHSAGDHLLGVVAERLRRAVRPADTVARFGGDEFVVLSEDVPDEMHAAAVAERIRLVMSEPVTVAGRETRVSVSIGIVLTDGRDDDPESVVRDADAAMYRAKERGRARYELFDAAMRHRVMRRLETEVALRRALEHDELRVLYQPEVSLVDGRVVGVEALVRWEHPERGLLAPGEFLSIAEETGLVVPLGRWVLERACRQLHTWQERFPNLGEFVVWVNLSARQLTQPDLPAMVAEVAAAARIEPGALGIELTESVLMEDVEAVGQALSALRRLGVQLAIDDFGTGFSSLSYLRRFPVGVLKIDRSFVSGLGQDAGDSAIVRAVVGLAHSLGLKAVAEGVETADQLAELRGLKCDVAQGYYLSRPAQASAIDHLLGPRSTGDAPIPRARVPVRSASESADSADGRTVRVLVCDDEPAARRLLRTAFELAGAVVHEAVDADDCLRAVATDTPDLVVLDLLMPGRGGLDALPEILARRPSVHVLVVTALPLADVHERTRALGADGCFGKGEFVTHIPDVVRRYASVA